MALTNRSLTAHGQPDRPADHSASAPCRGLRKSQSQYETRPNYPLTRVMAFTNAATGAGFQRPLEPQPLHDANTFAQPAAAESDQGPQY